jgi:hypothetical protein
MERLLFDLPEISPEMKKRLIACHQKTVNVNAVIWGLIGLVVGIIIA